MSILHGPSPSAIVLIVAFAANSADAQWSTASLSTGRQTIAAARAGGKAFFAGGRSGNTVTDVVDVYDEATHTWSILHLSVARTSLAATAVGNYVLFAGGAPTIAATTAVVDVLDASTLTWMPPGALSQSRSLVSATTIGGRAIFAGGNAGGGFNPIASAVVDIYDSSLGAPSNTAAWSTATLSLARGAAAATTVGNLVMFAGGITQANQGATTVDIYDASTGVWSVSNLSQPRAFCGVASTGRYAAFGGGNVSQVLTTSRVDLFDVETNAWSTLELSSSRTHIAATALGDTIYFGGGLAGLAGPVAVVDVLDASHGAWLPAEQLSQARGELSAVSVGTTAIFAGGFDGTTASSVVDLYAPTWIDLGAGTVGQYGIPRLLGSGSLAAGSTVTLKLDEATSSSFAHLVIGSSAANLPFYGGLLVPSPHIVLPNLPVGGDGTLTLVGTWPAGVPSGTTVFLQYLVSDPAANFGLAQSNAIQAIAP